MSDPSLLWLRRPWLPSHAPRWLTAPRSSKSVVAGPPLLGLPRTGVPERPLASTRRCYDGCPNSAHSTWGIGRRRGGDRTHGAAALGADLLCFLPRLFSRAPLYSAARPFSAAFSIASSRFRANICFSPASETAAGLGLIQGSGSGMARSVPAGIPLATLSDTWSNPR